MSGKQHSYNNNNNNNNNNNSRKRSRWGGTPTAGGNSSSSNNNNNRGPFKAASAVTTTVSDEDALRALLQSTAAAAAASQSDAKRSRQHHNNDRDNQRGNRESNRLGGDRKKSNNNNNRSEDYYGPNDGTTAEPTESSTAAAAPPPEQPNFGVSGALKEDAQQQTGAIYKGVTLKFREPPDARAPSQKLWRFYVYKEDALLETLYVCKQSAYLLGRLQTICDIPLLHPSCSSQHAVLQFRLVSTANKPAPSVQPYIMDLESANGTRLNGVTIDSARYYQLKTGDVLTFGASTREYVLMHP